MTRHPRGVAKGSDRDHSRWIARSIAITNNMLCKGQGEKCYGSMAPPFEDAIPKRIVYTPVCPPEVSFSRVSKVTPSLSQGFRGCRGLAVAVPSFLLWGLHIFGLLESESPVVEPRPSFQRYFFWRLPPAFFGLALRYSRFRCCSCLVSLLFTASSPGLFAFGVLPSRLPALLLR